jgi:hypothetical protein
MPGVLVQALTLACAEGYIRVFADEGSPMSSLITWCRSCLLSAADLRRNESPNRSGIEKHGSPGRA